MSAWNEQVKMTATTVNTTGIGLVATGIIQPLATKGEFDIGTIFGYAYFAIILHLLALYILGFTREG